MTMPASALEPWVGEVLHFWFEEIPPEAWFKPTPDIDRTIADRFRTVYDACARQSPEVAAADTHRALATILALDQFPRNMFRGTPQAFATDARALEVARRAVAHGLDQQVRAARRLFFYLPFEHSEDAGDQIRSVALIATLGDAELTRYAIDHKVLIDRFGRFPHRNAILGRSSTEAEQAYMAEDDRSFGQSLPAAAATTTTSG